MRSSATSTPKAASLSLDEWEALFRDGIAGYDPYRDSAGCWFDHESANKACRFFETRLRHVEGPLGGKLLKLETWQRKIIGAIFGWKREDNTRRYREVFFYVPRKNGKTFIIAGIAVLMLACSGEKGQQIYSAAADREQAKLCHSTAKQMITLDPELSRQMKLMQHCIETADGYHRYRALSSEANTKHGFNASTILVDEVHAHPNSELIDVLKTSTGARDQPLTFYTTTADFDRPSICNTLLDYAESVRDGVYEDAAFLPVVYKATDDDDWTDEAVWFKANPNLGVSVSLEFLRDECQKARRITSYQNTFRRLYLNQKTSQDNRWISLEDWDRCAGLDVDETPTQWRARIIAQAKGLPCYAGLDLGSVSDLTALTLLFDGDDLGYPGAVVLMPYAWFPGDSLDNKEEKNQILYQDFMEGKWVLTTTGNVADYAQIREDINSIVRDFDLIEIAVDRLFQGAQLCSELREQDQLNVIEFGQGFMSMAAPAKDFEERVKAGKVIHGGNPLLRWQVGNVVVKEDPHGNLKPVKPGRNSSQKIDNVVAAIMPLARYNENPHTSRDMELMFI